MNKKHIILMVLIACVAMIALAGCGSSSSSSSEEVKNDDQTFVVGLDDSFPPMGFRDDNNNIVGFDVDLAKEAGKRMGQEVKFQVINWDTKEMELNNDKIDAIWNGLSITDERKKNMDFTKPYLENDQIIVVKNGSTIAAKADLAGKKVGCQKGSSAYTALMADSIASQIDGAKPTEFDDNVSCFQDLGSGRIDAMVVDSVVAKYYIRKNEADFKILSDNLSPEKYGVAVKKGNTEMLNKIQKAMDEMIADGTAGNISKTWFGEDIIYKGN